MAAIEVFFRPNIDRFLLFFDPVKIEMIDRFTLPAAVFIHEGEAWAGHRISYPKLPAHCLYQRSFTSSHFPGKRKHPPQRIRGQDLLRNHFQFLQRARRQCFHSTGAKITIALACNREKRKELFRSEEEWFQSEKP